MSAVLWMVIVI